MRNIIFSFLIGLLIGEAGETYFRLKLEKDFIFKRINNILIIHPQVDDKLLVFPHDDEMILCIKNDCRKTKQWLQSQ